METRCYQTPGTKQDFVSATIIRREPLASDVSIDIRYAGICHSDLHQAREEWGPAKFPMVPGHEIVGQVSTVGSEVTNFAPGDWVGVGCMVDACLDCEMCHSVGESYCAEKVMTYNDCEKHETRCGAKSLGQQTQGGYSQHIVVNHKFVVKIPDGMDMARATPLLCAGITVYSPMAGKIKPGDQVGIVGLGGLGHVAVRIAQAMGAEVTLISRGTAKWALAFKEFDVKNYIDSTSDDPQECGRSLDFILDTVSGSHDYGNLVNLLKIGGEMCLVGLPTEGINIIPAQLVQYKRKISGSLIGGIKETQEMLNFCAQHKIHADIELISGSYINTAYERLSRSDVKYRFVINCETI